MASDPQIELRVSRLENDRDSVYELISDIRSTQQEHSRRFDAVDQRLDRVDERFDAVDQRLDTVDERLGSLDQRLGSIATTLTEVVRRLPDRS
ncbi:MAG TPA: hypothetical protein VFH38_01015 [Jatrophihabitans sp.]|nr:hypothetical protein [Jatrophihabitans sp.]